MVIYGSTAIKHFFPDYPREPKDLDLIAEEPAIIQIDTNQRVETYWEPELQCLLDANKDKTYLDPDLLYTLKLSHLSWDINWDKHMRDVIFLQDKGCKVNLEIYNILYKLWERIHSKKKVKMNVKNEEFFKHSIYRKYDHEFLHKQFSYYDRPLNERIRKDLNSPLCSEELWNSLTFDDKIKCSMEELMVLTAERYVFVPTSLSLRSAKTKMLKQMIISTTSGWFNLFLKENFIKLQKMEFPQFYYEKIKELI